ncbi:hypothetical protein [Novosphingobium sp.]|uniref:hypothetical protein n=1 Tax=Novosphingobium sp. TaxID=1874826 RepID=UPI002733D295|nr:hypothetical protein [Novosphingobium sp.]MDP3905617.1 hypothetical protein [Novosphingobium sp.]
MKRLSLLLAGGALALTSAFAIAQDAPESLLPPGFDKPRPSRTPAAATPAPVAVPAAKSGGTGSSGQGSVSVPVVQAIPGGPASAASVLPSGVKVPSLKELEAMTPDELDALLGLKPKSDMPAAARRSMKQVGVLAAGEGGLPVGSLARQNARLVEAALDKNNGRMVSRWGHILLRRALASRLDAPAGMNPADFTAKRAALLLRMGEGDVARAVVQDVDAGNYSPALIQTALDTYAFTADITGICPVVSVHGGVRKDPDWQVLRAICQSFQGDSTAGMAQLDRLEGGKVWPRIDILLAQKYAGAAGKARRAVTIEWDGVKEITPWRYALTIATGLEPPAALMRDAPRRYSYSAVLAPMVPLPARAAGADQAAAAGILSSAAMVDLYSQIYAQDDIGGDWSAAAETLRNAYTAPAASDRMAAIRQLWDGGSVPAARYSRQVLTAYAAARMPVAAEFKGDAAELIASMLAAGLDQNALRWAPQADVGSPAWAMLALAAPARGTPVDAASLNSFLGNDDSDGTRKSQFLLAGLMGLRRIDDTAAREFGAELGLDLARQTRWTRVIEQAADANNQALVVLLAGLGMQGDGWNRMTGLHLYHIVSALNRTGLSAEARMIAAEAVARG